MKKYGMGIWPTEIMAVSLIVFALQVSVLHMTNSFLTGILLSALFSVAGALYLYFRTQRLQELFPYLLLLCTLFLMFTGMSVRMFSPAVKFGSTYFLTVAILNWFLPTVIAIVIQWLRGGNVDMEFRKFFLMDVVFFYAIYILAAIYSVLVLEDGTVLTEQSVVPFSTVAAYIEKYIRGSMTVPDVAKYLLFRILQWIPIGFGLAMPIRNHSVGLKLLVYGAVPVVLELTELIFGFGVRDIDDILLGILGVFFGTVFFTIYNQCFIRATGCDFMENEIRREYFGRRIR